MVLLSQYRSFDDSYNRRFDPLSCSLKKKLRASIKMSNLKRQYSPWYRPMICIGKKFASGKGLLLGWLRVLSYFGEEGNSGESVCSRARLELHATRSPTPDFHITAISGVDTQTKPVGHFPLNWDTSLVCIQLLTKEGLPAGSTVRTAIASIALSRRSQLCLHHLERPRWLSGKQA